jgi:hypothetical protein
MKGLNFRDAITLLPYRSLIPRFRGDENLRLRIGTGYLNWGKEDQNSLGEGISWSVGSLSFTK